MYQGETTAEQLFRLIKDQIPEPDTEAKSIAFIILEEVFAVKKAEVLARKPLNISEEKSLFLEDLIAKLKSGMPVQYALGYTYFMGHKILCAPGALIPRPETEELVKHVLDFLKPIRQPSVLDLGTGTACIPIAIADILPNAHISAIELSDEAVALAHKNIQHSKVSVKLIHQSMTDSWPLEPASLDIVVSNPPYVSGDERFMMASKVLDFEPWQALFAPENDALHFYRAIAEQAVNFLKPEGKVFLELNEYYAQQTAELFANFGYTSVEVVNDVFDKPRFLVASQ